MLLLRILIEYDSMEDSVRVKESLYPIKITAIHCSSSMQ